MTNRSYKNAIVLMVLFINVVVGATAFYLYELCKLNFLLSVSKYSMIASLISIIILVSIFIFKVKKYDLKIKDVFLAHRLLTYIEENLISIGAYYRNSTNKIYYVPKVKIDTNRKTIAIEIDDVKIRKQIENFADSFSSALPKTFVIKDYYFNNSGSQFILKYSDISKEKQIVYKNLKDYLKHIDKIDNLSFEVDDEHIINLIDRPHFLLSGSSGSGKSYLTQLLTIQFLRKNYEVSIFDVKQSYSAFSDYVDLYETNPERIIEKLKDIEEEMIARQSNLSEILKINPRAIAVEYGYRQKIIIIEEYIGLKSLLDAKQIKELERIVRNISVLARSVNISLFIVAQSSSVDLIDASIKNNLNKIFMGYLASNIQISTFGNGVEVPTFSKIEKGFGYIQLDKIEQIKVPSVNYSVEELKTIK